MSRKNLYLLALCLTLLSASGPQVWASDSANGNGAPPAPGPESIFNPHFGFVVKASSLGGGGDIGMSFTSLATVRVGFNGLNFNQGFTYNGVHYNGTLQFRSAEAMVDITPLGDWFHVTPGLLVYNGNKIIATASVPGGQNFDLGGATFRSSPGDPIHGSGLLGVNKTAPMVLFGFGNPIPHHHHFTIFQDFGVVFQGQPKTTLNLAGTACDPITGLACVNAATDSTFQSQVQAEQTKINKDTTVAKFYPVFTIGLGFRF